MKFKLSFIEKFKKRTTSTEKITAQDDTNERSLVSGEFDSRNQSSPEVVIDFSNAVTIETPALPQSAAHWREVNNHWVQLHKNSSEWLSLTGKAHAAYGRKKYAVARDLFNEVKIFRRLIPIPGLCCFVH